MMLLPSRQPPGQAVRWQWLRPDGGPRWEPETVTSTGSHHLIFLCGSSATPSTEAEKHREFVMRNKICSKGIKMTTACISTAKGMASYLLAREHRGPGDTIEAAAHRIQTRFGVPVALLMRLRHREVNDMLASNFFALAGAFNEAVERAERRVDEAYEHEKALAIDPKIVRIAAALAGEKD